MPITTIAGLILTILVFLTAIRSCSVRMIQGVGLSFWLIAAVLGCWVPVVEVSATFTRWQHALDQGSALMPHQLVGAYFLHASMAPVGLITGFPEASVEVVALHSHVSPWVLPSDVVLHEPASRPVVSQWLLKAERGARGTRTWSYAWPGRYDRQGQSLRAALALNCPMTLEGVLNADAQGPFVDLRAECVVRWPKRSRIPAGTVFGFTIGLEEGVFRGVQDAGLIRPSTVVWTTRVRSGDPRLLDAEPTRGWLEWWLYG
ncbi:MAG: hypothetical protein AB8H79_18260 [Myxococcota bacterium]